MLRFRPFLPALAVAVFAIAAACAKDQGSTVLQADDLVPVDGPFDPNMIVDSTAVFTDSYALPEGVQAFLKKTPYKRPSFLATYQSNGVLAADAIQRAADVYQINPLVFLVRAQMEQGLIGQQYYPFPPSRVEYVFRCGCSGDVCDPALGGFDRQVDCLGRTLRTSLGQACGAARATAGGWGVGRASNTVDGVSITPANEATAALYQYMPFVNSGAEGGNWLFWNLFQKYALAVAYPGAVSDQFVGDSCCGDASCPYAKGVCAVNVSGGMCTASCDAKNPCPSDQGGRKAVCASLSGQGFCLRDCSASACRKGYACVGVALIGGGGGKACLPAK